jgi:hypothetical protein
MKGVKKGPPPKRGPVSQGLKKRGKSKGGLKKKSTPVRGTNVQSKFQ